MWRALRCVFAVLQRTRLTMAQNIEDFMNFSSWHSWQLSVMYVDDHCRLSKLSHEERHLGMFCHVIQTSVVCRYGHEFVPFSWGLQRRRSRNCIGVSKQLLRMCGHYPANENFALARLGTMEFGSAFRWRLNSTKVIVRSGFVSAYIDVNVMCWILWTVLLSTSPLLGKVPRFY